MSFPRALTLSDGITMVVTDLHGNGDAYDHVKQIFLEGYETGSIRRLLICGDLIHATPRPIDDSLRMITDVMALQDELGKDTVMLLCGNHEMPHIYGQPLQRGADDVTSAFEHALTASGQREAITNFLMSLPFFVLTDAGVMITHAGPTHELNTAQAAKEMLTLDHRPFLEKIDTELHQYDLEQARKLYASQYNVPYASLAQQKLAASGPEDPRFNHLLRAFILQSDTTYEQLWAILFAQNEQILPNDLRRVTLYDQIIKLYLEAISAHFPATPQHIVVSGHIHVRGGHQVVADHHLRLATHTHARPAEEGEYLLLDPAGTYADADALVPYLRRTYAPS